MATKAYTVKLSDDVKPLSDAAKDRQACGAMLGESAAQILLHEYGNRNQPTTPASERWYAAWNGLESALGVMAADPKIAEALKEVDDAYGNAIVEIEDRTWHAAWWAVMGLITGGTFSRTSSQNRYGLASRMRRD